MRIQYLAFIRLPTEKAHGLQIMKTCEAFAGAGAEVELVVPKRRTHISEDAFTYYQVRPSFKLSQLATSDFVEFGKLGFLVSLMLFAEAAHFRRSFWEADILYSRDALVLAQYVLLGRPFVYEAHTAPTGMSKFVARRAKRVVVISKGLAAAYEKVGVRPERIIVAPDAIDLTSFAHPESKESARTRLGLSLEKKIALYIGRLDGWKGVETLFDAASKMPDVQVAVIGGEPAQVESFKKKYPEVKFLGSSPYTELANNQSAADVLVLPNTAKNIDSLLYTSPLKLFTYMASDRPIVTADLPSIREVLTEDSAFFFMPDDSSSLAGVLIHVLTNIESAAKKAQAAKVLVQDYTWEKRAQHIISKL